MRILTLTYEYPPLGGGGARVAQGLARAFVRAGHEVDIVTMGRRGLPRETVDEGVRIRRVRCIRTRDDRSYAWELASYLACALPVALEHARTRNYDINHTHFLFPDGVLSSWLKRRTGLPFVVTAHGSDVPGYNPHRFRTLHRLLAPAWSKVAAAASVIASPSESLASLIHAAMPDASVELVPNGIDPDSFHPARDKLPRILAVSRIFERKGIQYVFQALQGQDLGYEVHIVGDGPYLPQLRQIARETGVQATFHGWLENPSPELGELYETASIFVLPSEAENFPIVLLEAQAAGLSIVTTASTGCAEVVGDAGLVTPPHDVPALRRALTRLIRDETLRARLGAAGRRRMEDNFSWNAVADRYAALFRQVTLSKHASAETRHGPGRRRGADTAAPTA